MTWNDLLICLTYFQLIKEQAKHSEEPPKPLRYLQKIEKPIPRPPTPAVTIPDNVSF